MSDLISRQAAIDYCYALINAENPSDPSDEWNYSQERINQTEVILNHLEFMPSAQPEPCEDAVSRKAVYDAMVEKGQRPRRYKLGEIWELNGTEIREALDTVPSAQPERKKGRWIDMDDHVMCSCCGATHYGSDKNFCPNCGADMRRNE